MTTTLTPKSNLGMQDLIVDLLSSLSAVQELSELDCQAGDEKQLIKNALSVLIQNQDMERCSFFLLDKDDCLTNLTGLSAHDVDNQSSPNYKPLRFKIGEGIIGAAAQTGEMQHCKDCQQDARFFSSIKQDPNLLPGSIISVPVFVTGEELIGVLNISHPQPHHFTEWHTRMLGIYKNMLGQLITNFRLFRQMEAQIEKRTAKLEKALVDLETLKEHYENISMIDPLTSLYNRRYFYIQAEIAIANTKRYGQSLCMLILDLDHFKKVNDDYGHGFGDTVLINVSKTLRQGMRDGDILVRFGGEEFVIIFTNTNCTNGKIFANRIRQSVEALTWEDMPGFNQTISVGLYCLSAECCGVDKTIDIDALIHYADIALYQAKEQGRNQVVTFSQDMLEG